MNKKGSAIIILIFIVIIAGVIAGWYFISHKTDQSNNPSSQPIGPAFSFFCSNSTTTLKAYENKKLGIAFCYSSDLIITSDTISWPTIGTSSPRISFWMLHDSSATTILPFIPGGAPKLFGDLAACEASGNTEDYCVFPNSNQITQGRNQNSFNYVLFRHNIDHATGAGVFIDVLQHDAGPAAFVPLVNQNYLAFAPINAAYLANSVYQADGFASLPSYVDKDLLEILKTVVIMPQQYNGTGIVLTQVSGNITVYNVIKNSPASIANIQAGEKILSINGISTATMDFDDANELLASATGTLLIKLENNNGVTTSINLIPTAFWVTDSDLAASYETPF